MAATSMGQFGTYKLAWSRQRQELESYLPSPPSNETVWVTKRYVPTDLRVIAPVPRHKPIAADVNALPTPEAHWLPPADRSSPWTYNRMTEPELHVASQPSTRCEEWSTLRQMLPSRGSSGAPRPPNWGTGFGGSPTRSADIKRTFPHINSPMTRYVDQMHGTNRLFKLY